MHLRNAADDVRFRHGGSQVVEICTDFLVKSTFSTSEECLDGRCDELQVDT